MDAERRRHLIARWPIASRVSTRTFVATLADEVDAERYEALPEYLRRYYGPELDGRHALTAEGVEMRRQARER